MHRQPSALSPARTESGEPPLEEFADVLDGVVRVMPGETFKIHLRDGAAPFAVRAPRRIPLSMREPLRQELSRLEQDGIIAPVTTPTDWCAPIVVAPKKDGGIRLCVDLSKLNQSVRRELYQSSTPAECAASIVATEAKWFSVFDAAKGYHQCPLDESSRHLTTFITPFGRYQYLRAPYGISSISEHYNRRMDECFLGMEGVQRVVDDVIVYSQTKEEHTARVRQFLTRCRERGVALNPAKTQHQRQSVKFAGFIVAADGYTPDPALTKAIAEFPAPASLTELRSFFGLANQVASFSEDTAAHLEPLRPLLSTKRSFVWDSGHQTSFERARAALASVRTLAFFDQSRPTLLSTDASRLKGLGFLLQQRQPDGTWRVVQAGSRFLTGAESRYATIELELLAVAWACHKCRLFLSGLPEFEIVTDHRPLVPILNAKNMDEIDNPRLQRLRQKLSMMTFTARWQRGADHQAADALSRAPVDSPTADDELAEDDSAISVSAIALCEAAELCTDLRLDEVRRAADRDEEAQLLLQTVTDGFPSQKTDLPPLLRPYWPVHSRLAVDDGLVVCGCRLVIPRPMRAAVLAELHASHQGREKTKSRARQIVFWPGLNNDINNITRSCSACQRELPSHPRETYRTREAPTRPFQHLCADFFEHAGRHYLLAVDPFSGWQFVRPLGRTATTAQLKQELRSIFCMAGVPEVLWTDGGPQFTARALAVFLREWRVQHRTSSPFYPQSNGRAEAGVKYAAKLIRRVWNERDGTVNQDAWVRGTLQYRNTPGPDGRSPAQIVLGHPVRDMAPAHRRSFAPCWQRAADELDEATTDQRQAAKERYNQHAADLRDLSVGSQVAIQDPATKRWSRHGVITDVGPHRRYYVRLPSGRVLTRNRRFLRQRYGHAAPDSPPPPRAAGSQGGEPPAAPPPPPPPPAPSPAPSRRSERSRRRPSRLIETCRLTRTDRGMGE